jgi:hypothetical protein
VHRQCTSGRLDFRESGLDRLPGAIVGVRPKVTVHVEIFELL